VEGPPETNYAKSGDVNIAYQVHGDGDIDLVTVAGFISHLDLMWEDPAYAAAMERLGSFARVIRFDKRGTGLSDPVGFDEYPSLEVRMDDVRAVMDAVGSEEAALCGFSEGAAMCLMFAATYPERTRALVLYGGLAKGMASEDYPWGPRPEVFEPEGLEFLGGEWGKGTIVEIFAPSMADNEEARQWTARFERQAASPAGLLALNMMFSQIDVRHILPTVQVPTLILHRKGDRAVNVRNSRYLAEHINGARYVELEGIDHEPWLDGGPILDEVEEFLTGVKPVPSVDRVLATVMFTDIVDSTKKAAEMGDRRWKETLFRQQDVTRRELERHRGREIKTTGDGFLATFDGPARGVRCAQAICDGVRSLGLEVRSGLHCGECEIMGDDIGGIAVHIASRVGDLAGPGEVLVSRTVKDLVAGSGISFEERGIHTLKGVPDPWELFAAT
jgi:class 3 adenylate cyclase